MNVDDEACTGVSDLGLHCTQAQTDTVTCAASDDRKIAMHARHTATTTTITTTTTTITTATNSTTTISVGASFSFILTDLFSGVTNFW